MYLCFVIVSFCLALPYAVVNATYKVEEGKGYYNNEVLDEADPETFEQIGCCEFAKDKDNVFVLGKLVEGVDPKTFERVRSDSSYFWDKENAYYHSTLFKDVDVENFEVLPGGIFAKDKNTVYNGTSIIADADPNSFAIVYFKDGGGTVNYAKDKNNVYFFSDIVTGADLENFELQKRSFNGDSQSGSINIILGIDEENVYYHGKSLNQGGLK